MEQNCHQEAIKPAQGGEQFHSNLNFTLFECKSVRYIIDPNSTADIPELRSPSMFYRETAQHANSLRSLCKMFIHKNE